jgi:hypothetical protein
MNIETLKNESTLRFSGLSSVRTIKLSNGQAGVNLSIDTLYVFLAYHFHNEIESTS